MSTDGRELVFVYGTLRRGGSNHFRMEKAEFISEARARGFLYRIDWYPGLVLDERGNDIAGEVYAVDPDLLSVLDVFEGISAQEVEGSEYRRVRTVVKLPEGFLSPWVWEWNGAVDESKKIAGGDWLNDAGA